MNSISDDIVTEAWKASFATVGEDETPRWRTIKTALEAAAPLIVAKIKEHSLNGE